MKKLVGLIVLMLIAGMLTGKVLFGRPSLEVQAKAAYDAKDWEKAYKLYKEFAETPEIRNAKGQKHDSVILRLDEIKSRLKPAVAATNAGSAPSQADLANQAMNYALSNNGDPPMSPETRIPHTKPKYGDVLTMSIKELGNFDFDPVFDVDIPADVKLMEGAHVKLSGYMVPLTQAVKVDKFALVPSLTGCCFGAPPGVQHVITCSTPEGKAMDYVLDELEIEGIVHVRVQREDNYTNSIFEMDVTSARIKE